MLRRAFVEKVVCHVVRDDRLLVRRRADLPYEETGCRSRPDRSARMRPDVRGTP
ncbi:MAG: hypothetical protein AB7J32_22125 [Pseudonocardia sp.]